MKKRVRRNYYKNSQRRKSQVMLSRVKLSLKALAFLVGTTLVSLIFILAHDALTQSRHFNARSITVDGNQRVPLERILELGQINVGDNILAMNLKLLRQRLLNNPWIADVALERELPDAVHIVVREHAPAAIVHFERDYYVSSTGEIIRAVSDTDKIDVPRLTGLTIADFASKGTRRSPQSMAFLKVVELSGLDGSILPLHEIERIDIDPQIGVTLSAFENRIAIKLGKSDYTGKFNRIRDMIAYLREGKHLRHVACIDLNDLDRVVVGAVEKQSLLGVCYRKET